VQSRNIGYIPEIDHLRLLAALLVFCFHFFHTYRGNWQPYPAWPWLGLVTEGHTGVALFFVLSGFIFMRIALEGGEIGYKRFLLNRVLRIAPLFVVVYVVAISIGRDRFVATDLLYLFVTNLGGAPTSWSFVTGPAWSISVEFWFYLIFPFLAAFTRKAGVRYLFGVMAMLLVVKAAAYLASDDSTHVLYSTILGRLDQFLIGMLAAMLYVRRRVALEAHGRLLLAAAVVLVALGIGAQSHWFPLYATDHKQPQWIVWGTIEASLWAALVVGYLSARVRWPGRLGVWLAKGGEASFSFYMWHALVMFLVYQTLGSVGGTKITPLLINGVVLLAITMAFSWLSYVTIERPFLTMRQRYVHREVAAQPAEAAE
jgi:peptidoglycan/LPS O-acetylase OafA/YrhL